MCGIAGDVALDGRTQADEGVLRRMLAMLQHRGPDDAGLYAGGAAALGMTRLSIVDVEGGRQPLCNEDGTVWVVCNGEIFNYVELREQLQAQGHRFRCSSDTEVIAHLYEEHGTAFVEHLVGDFAIALWDARMQRLLLARDRLGVRPLYYTTAVPGRLLFASEIKALLAYPGVPRELDPQVLAEVFTYWSTLPGRSVFRGISELRPGEMLVAEGGEVRRRTYWSLRVGAEEGRMDEEEATARLRALLLDSTRIRLRADVPVGTYLSGGIDSTAITGMVRGFKGAGVESFSITFADAHFDEREYQSAAVAHFGTKHHSVEITRRAIAEALPEVVWHAEAPVLRTAPVPMYILSRLVRDTGFKVVLTGEGADEVLGGYDIFKEAKIRRFWARRPESSLRPRLFGRLYGDIDGLERTPLSYLKLSFGQALGETDDPAYSHLIRWRSTARLQRFFSDAVKQALDPEGEQAALAGLLDGAPVSDDPLARAQFVEASIFLPQYLLSSQGDRVSMGNAVETRVPFLDHRVVEFCNTLPSNLKLRGLTEKYLLRRAMADFVPPQILDRPKRPYRAPTAEALLAPDAPLYIGELLSEERLRAGGYFDPAAVGMLVQKGRRSGRLSEYESMALVGVLTVQLLDDLYCRGFDARIERQPRNVVHRMQDEPAAVPA